MTKRPAQRPTMARILESTLPSGRSVGGNEGFSFVSELRQLEGEIAKAASASPACALDETFIGGGLSCG